MTDVAYIVGPPGVTSNEELRYSLRSVDTNLEGVGDVVMYGHSPRWVKARKVEEPSPSKIKHEDARRHLVMACNDPALSDPFWLFNDDFFVMQPMSTIPPIDRGEIAAQEKVTYEMKRAMGVLESQVDPPFLLYETHTPILVHKSVMLTVLKMLPERGLVKTVYMNFMGWESEHTGNAKVQTSTPRVWEAWPLLSTSNASFARGDVGHFIRERFPDPSRWEWQNGPGLP